MDFRRPVQSVIPGAQGRVLAVLAESTGYLNLRTVALLAGTSPAQASRILPELVRSGLVERREAPPSVLFRLVDDNLGSRVVRALSRSRETVLAELGSQAETLDPSPVSVIVFGSFARGEAEADSDLDVLFVQPKGMNDDDYRWAAAVEGWRQFARRLTGNRVEVVETSESSVGRFLRSHKTLWADIVRDGVVVYGKSLEGLQGRRRA
ncbi:MAG: nucleotidyltransferase domain-containing protein [Acidimicrobiales bacterium]|jgi:predicted nucleotidyltransferase